MSALIDLPDFAAARRGLRLPVPEFYNFGFDCIDRRAREADKTACLHVDANTGVEKAFSFGDLSRASNRFANVLLGLGAKKGDFAFSMVPRIPAWYETLIGCIKTGVVGMPGTNLLQPKDIEYRLNKSRAKFAKPCLKICRFSCAFRRLIGRTAAGIWRSRSNFAGNSKISGSI